MHNTRLVHIVRGKTKSLLQIIYGMQCGNFDCEVSVDSMHLVNTENVRPFLPGEAVAVMKIRAQGSYRNEMIIKILCTGCTRHFIPQVSPFLLRGNKVFEELSLRIATVDPNCIVLLMQLKATQQPDPALRVFSQAFLSSSKVVIFAKTLIVELSCSPTLFGREKN